MSEGRSIRKKETSRSRRATGIELIILGVVLLIVSLSAKVLAYGDEIGSEQLEV
jgi:hypothetical protein